MGSLLCFGLWHATFLAQIFQCLSPSLSPIFRRKRVLSLDLSPFGRLLRPLPLPFVRFEGRFERLPYLNRRERGLGLGLGLQWRLLRGYHLGRLGFLHCS